jgi:ELWxxDGT repeat protein
MATSSQIDTSLLQEHGVHGRELWSFDGTEARLVCDINPGEFGSKVFALTIYDGARYMNADDDYNPRARHGCGTASALASVRGPCTHKRDACFSRWPNPTNLP